MSTLNSQQIIEGLEGILGESKVKTDTDSLVRFGCDWTKIYKPAPLAVVLPKSAEDVQAVVKFANQHEVSLVPSGGRTGLSAGAVAAHGEVVIAFDNMNKVLEFNETDRSVKVQAGVVTEQLQQFAEEKGLFYPVDFASAGSSQIGGNISTNAGGIKVIRYGLTRDWVIGLKVVTGKGDMLELNKGLIKNATGYDLRHLFIGAEGTLGFICEATIQLARQPAPLSVMVLGVPEFDSLMNVLHAYQNKFDLTAFEFFSEQAVQKVIARGDVPRPFENATPYYALLEFENIAETTSEEALSVFEYCVEQGWVLDGVLSQSDQQARNLWRLREDISETISVFTPFKNDISVVVSKVPAFLHEVDHVVNEHYPDFEIIWFGHIGDGNLHLNILKPDDMPKEDFFEKCKTVNKWVYEIVQKHEGSISAEHGVGMTKKAWLQYSRSPEEIEYMRALKSVFDPKGIINPGKVLA